MVANQPWARRVAEPRLPCGNILRYNRARTDHRALAYSKTRKNHCTSPNARAALDHRLQPFRGVNLGTRTLVVGERRVWTAEHVIFKCDPRPDVNTRLERYAVSYDAFDKGMRIKVAILPDLGSRKDYGPLPNGSPVSYYGIVMDISQRVDSGWAVRHQRRIACRAAIAKAVNHYIHIGGTR